jgi:hypothetical protein
MAIAKARIITTNDAAIPVVVVSKTKDKKLKQEKPVEEGVEKDEVGGKVKKASKEEGRERREKGKKEKVEKKERKEKEKKEKKEKGKQSQVQDADEPGVKKSKKRKRLQDESTPASSTPDLKNQTTEARPMIDHTVKIDKTRESKEKRKERSKIKFGDTKGEEYGRKRKKTKKLATTTNATGLAVAVTNSFSRSDADVDMTDASPLNPDPTLKPSEMDILKKKKKKRKTVE